MKTSGVGWRVVLVALLATGATHGAAISTPRELCRAGGGTVRETGDPAVYICCYAASQRCLAVDERTRSSIRVASPDADGEVKAAVEAVRDGGLRD